MRFWNLELLVNFCRKPSLALEKIQAKQPDAFLTPWRVNLRAKQKGPERASKVCDCGQVKEASAVS